MGEVCFEEKFGFLKYLNERWLLYCITSLSFAAVFSFLWIISKFTFFEKAKIPRGSTPKFPYGNLGNVVSYDTSLHDLLWRYYNRFKKKSYDIAGLFFFTKPVIVVVNRDSVQEILKNRVDFDQIYPEPSQVLSDKKDILSLSSTDNFLDKYYESIRGTLQETLKNHDVHSALRERLLEMVSLAFGLNSFEIVDEINNLLNSKTELTFRHTLSLCYPSLKNKHSSLYKNLETIFSNVMKTRKKNDVIEDDYHQYFIDLFNESQVELKVVSKEMFDLYSDVIIHSYSVLLACLYELSRNEDVQDELIGEIRRFNKEYGVIDRESVKELQYLDLVIHETLRKHPPIPYVLKSSRKELKKNNAVLSKGTLFAISILGIQRGSEYYTNPEAFDPDRFNRLFSNFMPFGTTTDNNLSRLVILCVKLVLIDIFSTLKIRPKKENTQIFKYDTKLIPLRGCESYQIVFDTI